MINFPRIEFRTEEISHGTYKVLSEKGVENKEIVFKKRVEKTYGWYIVMGLIK